MIPTAAPLPRLAIVLSHPIQYYSPWFRWLKSNTPLEFRVFYLWDFGATARRDPQFQTTFKWDLDLLSGYEHEFVPNASSDPGTHHFGGLRNPALLDRLAAWEPAAVLVFGYAWASHLRVIAWARWRRIPLLFRGDSHFLGRGLPSLASRWALRLLYRQFAAFLPVGCSNRDYFAALGVPERRLFFAPHAVDHGLFDPSLAAHRESAAALRTALGLAASTRVVLFAGKFVAAKQPRELLAAFLALRPRNAALVFVGDGPEKGALIDAARSAVPGSVHFLPFANQSEMPARLLLADVFALPSRGHYETWGLAVNEAMHMGVPALVSTLVGCQRDLVDNGETGWVFEAGLPSSLPQKLGEALAAVGQLAERDRLRHNVLARISRYTYRETTAGLLAALASIGTGRAHRDSPAPAAIT